MLVHDFLFTLRSGSQYFYSSVHKRDIHINKLFGPCLSPSPSFICAGYYYLKRKEGKWGKRSEQSKHERDENRGLSGNLDGKSGLGLN